MLGAALWSSFLFLALAAECGTSDEIVPAVRDAESMAFDGVLALRKASEADDGAEVYSPDAPYQRSRPRIRSRLLRSQLR